MFGPFSSSRLSILSRCVVVGFSFLFDDNLFLQYDGYESECSPSWTELIHPHSDASHAGSNLLLPSTAKFQCQQERFDSRLILRRPSFLSIEELFRRTLSITTDESQLKNHFHSFELECWPATTATTIYSRAGRENDFQVVSKLITVWAGKDPRVPEYQFFLYTDSEAVVLFRSATG